MGCRNCIVTSNNKLADGLHLMSVEASDICSSALPGQFVHVRLTDEIDPLLRRPFCIYRIHRGEGIIDLLYRVAGRGTALMTRKKPGEMVNILGPLGTGFTISGDFSRAVIVAGGMGIAPMVFLIEELLRQGISVTLFWGARTASEIFMSARDFPAGDLTVHTVSEDGNGDQRGYVTDIFTPYVDRLSGKGSERVYTCGPVPMLKKVQEIMRGSSVPVEASLEERMACGIGVCAGCSVTTAEGKKLVCKDGPVMNLMEIVYDE